MARRHAQRGFTLIELMTVIAIIAVLSAVLVSVGGSGAGTPRTTADRITGIIQFAKLRAEARRTIHRVRFENQVVSVWEATVPGFVATPVFPTEFIQAMDIPSGVIIHSASVPNAPGNVLATSGNTTTANANLPFDLDIRPDGSTTGGTLFITDTRDSTTERFRVFIYKVTGAALSRELW